MSLERVKSRFDIIGDNPRLNRALEIALQVADTDLTVLVMGESGVGKEVIPKVIHTNSVRKHNKYFAINCGAIPEGTVDSELFGHEKGAFTGAVENRKGYFEEANGGTLFLDEVAELPISTQARLLRVLQSGEFIRVGSSKVQKTDVRVVAATNIDLARAIESHKFREDLYYRLNTVPITIPALRERYEDIHLLFKKFALDFAERNSMPKVTLTPDAIELLSSYRWPGNVRQLKSVTEQLSLLEPERVIDADALHKYLPIESGRNLPMRREDFMGDDYSRERNRIYSAIYSLRQEVARLKEIVESSTQPFTPSATPSLSSDRELLQNIEETSAVELEEEPPATLSIQKVNEELIRLALERHGGKRKPAAEELGISERTLYRKIKELDISL
ncbi:MAG: sigma-54 dependent transcriptional regulator [Bacteroidales bacterium]